MERVLITGATGFIGNHLTEELLSYPIKVITTSRSSKKAKEKPWFSKVDYFPFNFKDDYSDCYQYFNTPSTLIHLAWRCLPNYNELFHFEKILHSQYAFLKQMIEEGVKNVVVLGTCFEYGLQEGLITEEMPTNPITAYGIAKDSLRRFLQQLQKKLPFQLKWIRLFYVYGPGQRKRCLFSQLEKAIMQGDDSFKMSPGDQIRDYLPVEKAAHHIAKIALQCEVNGIIHCCSGNALPLKAHVAAYLKKRNANIKLILHQYPYLTYEPHSFWGDDKKLKLALLAFDQQEGLRYESN